MADTPRKNWFARALDAAASTETNPLALAWRALPPNVRATYASLPNAVAELTPGAAIRDTVQASGETAKAAMQGRGWDAAGGVANMLAAAAGVVPGSKLLVKGAKAANPIRAYHGSPHDFDRFDMSKIGTGEGAQAYGHGLYFAENEGVARGYRDALSLSAIDVGGKKMVPAPRTAEDAALSHLSIGGTSQPGDPYGYARNTIRSILKYEGHSPAEREKMETALKLLDDWQLQGGKRVSGGSMYEVNIHADPAKFLDWDKPLSAQSKQVQDAVLATRDALARESYEKRGLPPSVISEYLNNYQKNSPLEKTGREVIGGFNNNGGAAQASLLMNQGGIPGVKYLDGGSRSAGDGSRNYVAFDDKLIEILRKYGLLPVAAGGAAVAANPLSTGEERAY